MKKNLLFITCVLGSIVLITVCNFDQAAKAYPSGNQKPMTFLASCKANILGTWISKDSQELKMTFTKDSCYQINNGKVFEKDLYRISLVSPPCGVTKSSDPGDVYLTLTNIEDKNNTCMEILDLTKKHYAYRAMEATNNVMFEYDKQR